MTDMLRTVAADLLEVPEESMKLLGQALSFVGDEMQKLSDRIAALETGVKSAGDQ